MHTCKLCGSQVKLKPDKSVPAKRIKVAGKFGDEFVVAYPLIPETSGLCYYHHKNSLHFKGGRERSNAL